MHRTFRHILEAVVFAAIPAIATAEYSFTLIDGTSGATGVSADGSIVVGGGVGGAYYWTADGARVDIGGMGAVGLSDQPRRRWTTFVPIDVPPQGQADSRGRWGWRRALR
jgi:hypothetical protein